MLSARSGGLGTDTGSSKKTIMLSPVKRSSTPAWAAIRRPISAWYSRRTSSTSSGSAVSEKAVKPRRSMKTTVTCRWHSSWRLPRGRLTSRRAGTDLRGQTQRRVARERHRTISAPALAEASDVRGPIGYDAGWVRVTADNAKIASPKRTSHAAPATATSHQRFQTKRGRQSLPDRWPRVDRKVDRGLWSRPRAVVAAGRRVVSIQGRFHRSDFLQLVPRASRRPSRTRRESTSYPLDCARRAGESPVNESTSGTGPSTIFRRHSGPICCNGVAVLCGGRGSAFRGVDMDTGGHCSGR